MVYACGVADILKLRCWKFDKFEFSSILFRKEKKKWLSLLNKLAIINEWKEWNSCCEWHAAKLFNGKIGKRKKKAKLFYRVFIIRRMLRKFSLETMTNEFDHNTKFSTREEKKKKKTNHHNGPFLSSGIKLITSKFEEVFPSFLSSSFPALKQFMKWLTRIFRLLFDPTFVTTQFHGINCCSRISHFNSDFSPFIKIPQKLILTSGLTKHQGITKMRQLEDEENLFAFF